MDKLRDLFKLLGKLKEQILETQANPALGITLYKVYSNRSQIRTLMKHPTIYNTFLTCLAKIYVVLINYKRNMYQIEDM